jgi:hypothetical protein
MFNSGLTIIELEGVSNSQKAEQILAKTQIFGGIGSWNDSPRYSAYKLGVGGEFDFSTTDFFNQQVILKKKLSSHKKSKLKEKKDE